jgi:hypothetical protein
VNVIGGRRASQGFGASGLGDVAAAEAVASAGESQVLLARLPFPAGGPRQLEKTCASLAAAAPGATLTVFLTQPPTARARELLSRKLAEPGAWDTSDEKELQLATELCRMVRAAFHLKA